MGEMRRKKFCYFTENKIKHIDYRDERLLRRFVNERGKLLPRRITGTSAYWQRQLARAIKRARIMAIMPFESETFR